LQQRERKRRAPTSTEKKGKILPSPTSCRAERHPKEGKAKGNEAAAEGKRRRISLSTTK